MRETLLWNLEAQGLSLNGRAVILAVDVIDTVAVHVHGNDTVGVIFSL